MLRSSASRRTSASPDVLTEVTVPIRSVRASVIPQTAVRPSERGFLAYVIAEGDVAKERVVTLGMRTQEGRVEVKDGLAPGERLVVRGAEALRDGAQVRIVQGPEMPGGMGGSSAAGARSIDAGHGAQGRGSP